MTQNVPWSVKGIDPQAREAAKDAARKAGMTLGAWLNSMIAETTQPGGGGLHRFSFNSESQDIFAHAADRFSLETAALKARAAAPPHETQRGPADLENLLGSVAKRLDAMETRLDTQQAAQPMLSMVEKLEQRLESLTAAVQPPGATAAEDMLRTLETRLTDIIVRLGPDASAAIAPRREAAKHVHDGLSESGDQQEPVASPYKAMSPRGATPFHEPITRPGSGDADSDRFAATIAEIRRRQARLSEEGDQDIADTLANTLADTEDADMDETDKARPSDALTGSARRTATPSGQAVASGLTNDFMERLDTLTEKIDALLLPDRFPVLDGVIERLDRIDAHIEHPKLPDDFERVEQLLSAVAARLESHQGNALDAESLDALETQIAHLARRVDDALRSKLTDVTLEKMLADLEALMIGLVDRAQGIQKETIQSVEFATRTAVTDALGAKIWDGTGDMNGLKADIADLKSVHSAMSERTQDTLSAVHQTLELVVQRLTLMESERAVGRKADLSRALFEKQAAQILAADREAIPPTATSRHAEPARATAAEAVLTATPDVKSSFIAAARRAAQTANVDMAGPAAAPHASPEQAAPARSAPASAKADAATIVRGRGESLIERLRHGSIRRRNVVFGIAGLVIAIGAAQLIVSFGRLSNDGAVPPATGQHSAAPPEPAAAVSGLALAQPHSAMPSPPTPQPSALGANPRTPNAHLTDSAASGPAQPLVLSDFANPLAQPSANSATGADAAMTTGSIKPSPEALVPETKAAAVDAIPAASEPAKPREMTTALPGGMLAGIPASIGTESLRQAAEKGNAAAVYEFASRLAEGRGMSRDMKMAARLFEAQAEAGFAPAQYRIANHYEKGFGVDRDLAKAREWYLRAAEAGNAKAMHNLAVLYAEGVSGRPDYPTAVKWFRKAAEFGVRDSQFNLAILAARGLGMDADLAQSYTWFAILAENGDADAAEKRDSVGVRLSPTDLTLARAAAEQWVAKTPDPAANTVEVAPEWSKPSVPKGTTGDASPGGKTKSRG